MTRSRDLARIPSGTYSIPIGSLSNASFPPGTKLVFAQASAPTGWTQVLDDSATNRMLRVVNGGGGAVGGSHSPILNNIVPSHTHGFNTGTESSDHSHTGNTGSVSNDHQHYTIHIQDYQAWGTGGGSGPKYMNTSWSEQPWCYTSGATSNHYHGFSTGGRSATHTHSGTTDNGSSQTNWTPRYIDLILCSKD
jgi:hypothetical protein